MTPLTRLFALLAGLILAGGILAVSLPAASSGAAKTTKLCHSQTASVSRGAYMVDNNEWGSRAPGRDSLIWPHRDGVKWPRPSGALLPL
jgi:hypothetical protein